MPAILRAGRTPVAYVEGTERVVVKRDVAVLIYRCLGAYFLNVEPGVEDRIATPLGRIDGIKVSVLRRDATEDYVVEAIRVCFAFKTGTRLSVEKTDKILEVTLPKKEGEEGEAESVEVERP